MSSSESRSETLAAARKKGREQRERSEKREEGSEGPGMVTHRVKPPEGDQPFSTPYRPLLGPLAASSRDRGQREESREKREERREKRENGHQLDSLHFYGVPWPPQKSYENPMGAPK